MANEETHHEFRFVVSGVHLSDEAQQTIARAVADAGALALAQTSRDVAGLALSLDVERPVRLRPEWWWGKWIRVIREADLEKVLQQPINQVIDIQAGREREV